MQLDSFLDPRLIMHEQRILDLDKIYQDLVELICRYHKLPVSCSQLMRLVRQREEQSHTAYPSGIGIPHVRLEGLDDTLIAMSFLQNPVQSEDIKVSWVVMIITDKSSSNTYLNIVSALLKMSRDAGLMEEMKRQHDGHGVVQVVKQHGIEVKKEVCIGDIMTSSPVSVGPDTLLSELSLVMSDKEISMVPVTDEEGRYLGEVSVLDLLKVGVPDYLMMIDNLNFLLSFEPLEKLFETMDVATVGEIMETEEPVLHPKASIVETVALMIRHRKRFVSIVDEGKLVGVVTAKDILRKVITV